MSRDSEPNPIKETETVSENNLEHSTKGKQWIYCFVCQIQCTCPRNYKDHLLGKRHLRNISDCSLQQNTKQPPQRKKESPSQQNTKQPPQRKKESPSQQNTKQKTQNKSYPSKKMSKTTPKPHIMNLIEKTENCVPPAESTSETMSNASKYDQNVKYNSPHYESKYARYQNSRHHYSAYGNGKDYYNNKSYHDYPKWNPYSYSSQNNFNYRSRQHYSQGRYKVSHDNDYSTENNRSFSNFYNDYAENFNSGSFDQNLVHVKINDDDDKSETPVSRNPFSSYISPPENPFRQYYSQDSALFSESSKEKLSTEVSPSDTNKSAYSSKSFKEKLSTEASPSDANKSAYSSKSSKEKLSTEASPSDINKSAYSSKSSNEKLDTETNDSNTNKTTCSSIDDTSVSKKSLSATISKARDKRIRSRSLSSSESEKRRKDKTEPTESEGSEEQRIQEWTNSLLETNHNKITRLLNPSNHKEKAAVNHLMTKLNKSKRKESLIKILRTNSTDNDVRDVNSADISVEAESVSTEDEDISIVLDSTIENPILDQCAANLNTPSTNKASSSNCNSTNQSQINKNILESSKPPISETCSTNNSFTLNKSLPVKSSSRYKEKPVKRKSTGSGTKVKKKQKTINLDDFITCNVTVSADLNTHTVTPENNICPPVSNKVANEGSTASDIKKEVEETSGRSSADAFNTTSVNENNLEQNVIINPDVSVEALMQLFASGNVKVKEEFNDPVMDALKEMNPDELISACSNNPSNAYEETVNESAASSDKSPTETAANTVNSNKNCASPLILGSAAIGDNVSALIDIIRSSATKNTTSSANSKNLNDKSLPPVNAGYNNFGCLNPTVLSSKASCDNVSTVVETSDVVTSVINESISSQSVLSNLSPSVQSNIQNHPLLCGDVEKNSDHSLWTLSEHKKTKVELPPYLNKLINELQLITSQEETIKQHLTEAKSKINECTSLLEEWKRKKKALHSQEEDLCKKRNNIIKLMQNAVETSGDKERESASSVPKDQLTSNKEKSADSSETSFATSPSISAKKEKRNGPSTGSSELDEIIILPAPSKPQPPEIIICDDEENMPVTTQAQDSRHETDTEMSSSQRPSIYDLKTVNAHKTIINCLVVFEEFLYTSSNDNTAKRFSLKDASLSVTYYHAAKNVTEVVVEKVQNEALVFTCSARFISLFIASTGTKIKTFYPPCHVMSICKGWGRFYSGLANGTVNMYNWKYEEHEIVKTEQPASRLATAHQGRLHVLVILSSEGNISIRDAETGLLIRYIKICIKSPSWMCLHNDLAYLSSSDKILIILDIMSGRVEKRIYMNSQISGLAVCDDSIFTITFSGIINCYDRDKSCDRRLFYGAEKAGLTCVHVYQNWVFTGNRKGVVGVFHFDPLAYTACEFGKCDVVYGLKEDLEFHVEKDHLLKKKNLTQCSWRDCGFTFPKSANKDDKMNHLKTHIYEINNTPSCS